MVVDITNFCSALLNTLRQIQPAEPRPQAGVRRGTWQTPPVSQHPQLAATLHNAEADSKFFLHQFFFSQSEQQVFSTRHFFLARGDSKFFLHHIYNSQLEQITSFFYTNYIVSGYSIQQLLSQLEQIASFSYTTFIIPSQSKQQVFSTPIILFHVAAYSNFFLHHNYYFQLEQIASFSTPNFSFQLQQVASFSYANFFLSSKLEQIASFSYTNFILPSQSKQQVFSTPIVLFQVTAYSNFFLHHMLCNCSQLQQRASFSTPDCFRFCHLERIASFFYATFIIFSQSKQQGFSTKL